MRQSMPAAFAVLVALIGSNCSASVFSNNVFARKNVAAKAQEQMVGMTKADVLSCMGVPEAKEADGKVEVWAYSSGNGRTDAVGTGTTNGTVTATSPNQATVTANSSFVATRRNRFCTVSIVLTDGKVSKVNYSGPTGGLLTQGEQCSYAVQNCVKQDDPPN